MSHDRPGSLDLIGRRAKGWCAAIFLRRDGRRLRADQGGATVVEFAIVAPVLIPILLGIIDLGLLFITNSCLDLATASFATQIRTGQIQAPGTSATTSSGAQLDLSDAKTWICQQMAMTTLSACISQLQLDVRPLPSYQQVNATSPISNGQFSSSGFCYYSGNAGDMVQIRAYYLYSLIDPLLLATFSSVTSYGGANGHFFPITATQVFRSETYSTAANSGAAC